MSESIERTLATTAASRDASTVLSPSRTNWSRDATGTDQFDGRLVMMRRVKPPPGMKGIGLSGLSASGYCETGEL